MGTLANVVLYRLIFPLSLPAQGILNMCSDHTLLYTENKGHWKYTQKEREWTEVPDFIQFFGYIYRPLEAVAQCLELCWRFQGKRIFGLRSSEDLEWFVWKGYFWSLFLDSRSRVFPCLLLSGSETRTGYLLNNVFSPKTVPRKTTQSRVCTLKWMFVSISTFSWNLRY